MKKLKLVKLYILIMINTITQNNASLHMLGLFAVVVVLL